MIMYAVEFSLRIKSLFCRPSVPEKSKSSLKGLEERIGRLWHPMTRKLLDMAYRNFQKAEFMSTWTSCRRTIG